MPPEFDRCANFRWGGIFHELVVATCATAALLRLVDGIVSEEEGRLMTAEEALEMARQNVAFVMGAA